MPKKTTRTVARSSKSGKFVSKNYAKTHKTTTEVQRVKTSKKK